MQPVDNLPVLNVTKAGSGVPVKFKLGGNKGMAVFAAGSPKFVTVPFSVTDPVAAIETTISAGAAA
ncbi:PxKF domain-containing protein [Deinococcus malanensis]|uniref:PxKF domain-containing protein n=1 Tax=Deinococcus malanensis TaxID=1706855 RepID=UPI003638ED00